MPVGHGSSATVIRFVDAIDALRSITAQAIVIPSQNDLYFPPADIEIEVSLMSNAEFRPMGSIWGNLAGGPGFIPPDAAFVDATLRELQES